MSRYERPVADNSRKPVLRRTSTHYPLYRPWWRWWKIRRCWCGQRWRRHTREM